jgi:hypothetical protein
VAALGNVKESCGEEEESLNQLKKWRLIYSPLLHRKELLNSA